MEDLVPSRTAQGAAMHRAAHQLFDDPQVFADPLALSIVGKAGEKGLREGTARQALPESRGMRAFLVARSRFTEDSLAAAMARGVRQYVLLGAGLDTFAYRAGSKLPDLTVYEVDHSATQAWKRQRLAEAGIDVPGNVVYAPVNFERETLADGLARAGFGFGQPAFFAWLGVVPYLTREAVMGTLAFVARSVAAGSEIVFDYPEPIQWETLDSARRAALEKRLERFADLGEPLISNFEPSVLAQDLRALGFSAVQDFDLSELNARYFDARQDGLKMEGRGHVMKARV